MKEKIDKININSDEEQKIKDKSPDKLPLNPSALGYSGSQIRKKFSEFITDNENSVMSLLKEKLTNIKTVFEEEVLPRDLGDITDSEDIFDTINKRGVYRYEYDDGLYRYAGILLHNIEDGGKEQIKIDRNKISYRAKPEGGGSYSDWNELDLSKKYVKTDGSVPMTGHLDMGGWKIRNLEVGITDDAAVNRGQLKDYLKNIWTDVANQTTTFLNDELIINRGNNVYKTTLANLLTHATITELFTIVSELPELGMPNKIYLVPETQEDVINKYAEFIWVDNSFERIGTVEIDLENYFNKSEVNDLLNSYVLKEANMGLSEENFSGYYKQKLDEIDSLAQKNVQSDWNAVDGDAFIKNKPVIPSKVSELENDSNYEEKSNKKTSLIENSDNFYPTQRAVNKEISILLNKIKSIETELSYQKVMGLCGKQFWYDADKLSLGNVSLLEDLSTNGNNLVQENAADQPVIVLNEEINRKVLHFDGVSDFMEQTTATVGTTDKLTLFMSFALADPNGGGQRLLTLSKKVGASPGLDYSILKSGSQNKIYSSIENGTDTGAGFSIVDNYDFMYITSVVNGGVQKMYKNGVFEGEIAGDISAIEFTRIFLGKQPAGQFFNGFIGEAMLFNRVLTTEETNIVNKYFKDKWVKQIEEDTTEYPISTKHQEQINALKLKLDLLESEYDFKMAYITDQHYGDPSGISGRNQNFLHLRNVAEVSKVVELDVAIHGGDQVYDYVPKSEVINCIEKNKEEFRRADCPSYFLAGNHDFGDAYAFRNGQASVNVADVITPSEWGTLTDNPVGNAIYGDDSKSYYYIDFPEKKIRIIVLNTQDAYVLDGNGKPKYNRSYNWQSAPTAVMGIRKNQLNWLANTALNFDGKNGYSCIVVSHTSLAFDGGYYNTDVAFGLIKSRKEKTSYSIERTDGVDFNVEISADYTGKNDVDFICCINGHSHNDTSYIHQGIQIIETTSSNNSADTTDSVWDVFCLNKTTRTVKIKRFGDRGTDREFTY